MPYSVEHCAIVVLAAGASSRLGSPKQLLPYKGRLLLQYVTDVALQTGMRPVVIITGEDSDAIKKQMEGMEIELVKNEGWQEGMASSLLCGLVTVQKKKPGADGIIFMVCDQPYVTSTLLDRLLQAQHETGLPVVASHYQNSLGTPALFHQSFFTKLLELKGDIGARKLIKKHEELVATVSFPEGIIDIDTRADYELLLR
ncbi:MAG: nucleotidyltransferase family protein [Ginsengibacter sp.]